MVHRTDTDGSDEFFPVLEVKDTASKGSYNKETGVISINTGYDYLQRIKTLLHEYAQAIDFTMNPGENIQRNIRELVAESAAFIVMQYMGFDTGAYQSEIQAGG